MINITEHAKEYADKSAFWCAELDRVKPDLNGCCDPHDLLITLHNCDRLSRLHSFKDECVQAIRKAAGLSESEATQ